MRRSSPPFVTDILFFRQPASNGPTPCFLDPSIIKEYLHKRWISPIHPAEARIFSRIFTIRQKDKVRLIFDCRHLNKFVKSVKFKLEDLRTTQRLIKKGDYFCKLDLTKAYHQVAIRSDFRPFLSFLVNGQYFCFNVLPFGLTSAPLILTKALKPAIAELRQRGIRSVIYLDDILIMADSPQLLRQHVLLAIDMLNSRGWELNFQKCSLIPSQQIDYIGAHIVSTPTISVSLSTDSHTKLLSSLHLITSLRSPKTHLVRSCLGQLNWSLRFNNLLKIFKANLQTQLINALNQNQARISISSQTRHDLNHLSNLPISSFSMPAVTEAHFIISSDATPNVISASIRDDQHIIDTTSALDPSDDHIAIKECKAVLLATERFKDLIANNTVLFSTDNQVVLYALRSAHSSNPELHAIVRQIYLSLLANPPTRVWFSWIASELNVLADGLSRPSQENWALNRSLLDQIISITGFKPSLELFADESNNLLPSFSSQLPNRRAAFTDAFSKNWNILPPLYANPPFSLLPRVLHKISIERPDILLVAPFWPSSPWFPLLLTANALFRMPRHQLTFSFLGRTAGPPHWTPIVAIFRKNQSSRYREGRIKLTHNIPYISLRPDNLSRHLGRPKPTSINPVTFLPTDATLFSESRTPTAISTRSSIIL
jgi:hypothetical protein